MSLPSNRPVLTVDLAALSRNANTLTQQAGCPLAPSVKANAYGLGAPIVTRTLHNEVGARSFFVAYADEAMAILKDEPLSPETSLFVLNGPAPEDREAYQNAQLLPVINSVHDAMVWQEMSGGPYALAIDIGMNRLGMTAHEAHKTIDTLGTSSLRHLLMHLSHSGDRDAPQNIEQIQEYQSIAAALKSIAPHTPSSLSASGGVALKADVEEDFSRVGAALYGLSPTGLPEDALHPVATLSAPVLLMRTIRSGETVGYNGTWAAEKDSVIAILSIGYADGLSRAFSNVGHVAFNGERCPIIGTISMDLLAVDVTSMTSPPTIGQHAEIFGKTIAIDEQASRINTIGYELLSTVGARVERRYMS